MKNILLIAVTAASLSACVEYSTSNAQRTSTDGLGGSSVATSTCESVAVTAIPTAETCE